MAASGFLPFRRSSLLTRTVQALLYSAAAMVMGLSSAQQAPPSVQGTSIADSAVPAIISPAVYGTDFFVLNQDMTSLAVSTASSYRVACAAPAAAVASSTLPKALANDTQNAYAVGPDANSTVALTGLLFGSSVCRTTTSNTLQGASPAQALIANDEFHGRAFTLNSSSSGGPDILTQYSNLSTGSGDTITRTFRTSLDSGARYTSLLVDGRGQYGLVIATELKTSTSPGNLWVYSPGISTAFKILDPSGNPLPASNAFILPAFNDGGGDLLVLVNQDNLTAANLSSAPQDTVPFTIIDLGQLQRTFSAVVANGNTITLPFTRQIRATNVYAAVLGAVYDPVSRLLYAVVGSGSNSARSVLSYNPYSPDSPSETVIADVSNVPYTFGVYPQLAVNSASGSLQILTTSPSTLFTVGITGTGNTTAQVSGTSFSDSNFQPTYITANPLFGQTYIASASGQVDVLTKPPASSLQATITLNGSDTATAGASYSLRGLALYSQGDSSLTAAAVTITATVRGGSPVTLASTTVGALAYPGSSVSGVTFSLPGVYTLVATVPATATHAAITSNTISVTVGDSTTPYPGVYPTTLSLSVPATSTSTSVTAALTLAGSTYAPSGRIVINDASGSEVGRYTFTGAATAYPVQVQLTLPQGSSTLTAVYNGDDQNAGSTSSPASISVRGNSGLVTPTLALTVPSSATAGATLSATVTFTSTTTDAPTDTISIYAVPAGTTTPTTVATIPAAQAFSTSGKTFSFTAPAAGQYTLLAYYPGDSKYATAQSNTSQLTVAAASLGKVALNVTVPATGVEGSALSGSLTTSTSGTSSTPTGVVKIYAQLAGTQNSTTLATLTLGTATSYPLNFTAPGAGVYTVFGFYQGDKNFDPAQSANAALTVSPSGTFSPSLQNVALQQTAGSAQTIGLNATVTGGNGNQPSGNVTLTARPATGGAVITLATAKASLVNLGIAVSFTAPASPGSYIYTLNYAGDSRFAAGISAPVTVNVNALPLPTTVNASSRSTVTAGSSFSTTILLQPQAGGETGSIVVQLLDSSGNVVATDTVSSSAAASASGGVANLTTIASQAAGNYTLRATYPGDANYAASAASAPISLTAPASPTYTLTLNDPPNATDFAGQRYVKYTLTVDGSQLYVPFTVTAVSGFNQPVVVTMDFQSDDPNATYVVRHNFVDAAHTTGSAMLTFTPSPSGSQYAVNFQSFGGLRAQTRPRPLQRKSEVLFAGLLTGSFALAGLRRKRNGLVRPLLLLTVITSIGMCSALLSGCSAVHDPIYVTITAQPQSAQGDAQKQMVKFVIDYAH